MMMALLNDRWCCKYRRFTDGGFTLLNASIPNPSITRTHNLYLLQKNCFSVYCRFTQTYIFKALSWNEIKSRTTVLQKNGNTKSVKTPKQNLLEWFYRLLINSQASQRAFSCSNLISPFPSKTHQALDKSVDLCYRIQLLTNETSWIVFFELYDKCIAGLFWKRRKNHPQINSTYI